MSSYPTEQWLTAYGRALDGSAALDDLADGWGVGFNGDVLLAIEDVPLAETTIGELPDEVMADLPEDIRAGVSDVTLAEAPTEFGGRLRTALPASVQDLLHQIESKVHDGTIYAYVGLEAGDCTGTAVLETPGDREVGYVVHGPYETWRRIIDGRPAVSAVLSGDLGVTGNRLRLLRYASVLHCSATSPPRSRPRTCSRAGPPTPARWCSTRPSGSRSSSAASPSVRSASRRRRSALSDALPVANAARPGGDARVSRRHPYC